MSMSFKLLLAMSLCFIAYQQMEEEKGSEGSNPELQIVKYMHYKIL